MIEKNRSIGKIDFLMIGSFGPIFDQNQFLTNRFKLIKINFQIYKNRHPFCELSAGQQNDSISKWIILKDGIFPRLQILQESKKKAKNLAQQKFFQKIEKPVSQIVCPLRGHDCI